MEMQNKMLRLFYILFMCIALVNCSEHKSADPLGSYDFTTTLDDNKSSLPSSSGTSSSGGGFADEYALNTLRLAKASLSQMILNTNPALFSTFPEGKGQEWFADLILRVEHRAIDKDDEHGSRYNRPLKFNYDEESEVIFATNTFVSRFPYGRFITQNRAEQLRILTEVQLDILHEASHFLGIGRSEESDINSEYWSLVFMASLTNERFYCYKADDEKLLEIIPVTGAYNESSVTEEDLEKIIEDEIGAFSNDSGLSLTPVAESSKAIFASMIHLAQIVDPEIVLDYILFDFKEQLDHEEAFSIFEDEDFNSFASLGDLERTSEEFIFRADKKFATPIGEWLEQDTSFAGVLKKQAFTINRDSGLGVFSNDYSIFHPEDTSLLTPEELADIEDEFHERASMEIQCRVSSPLLINVSDYISDERVNPIQIMAEDILGTNLNFMYR